MRKYATYRYQSSSLYENKVFSDFFTGKALNFSGSLYSEEHKRKFNVENAEIKVFSDFTKPNQLFLYINRQPIVEWLKKQWNNLRSYKRQMIKY